MEAHSYLSDQEFIQQFANCELPAHVFSHEAHLRLAWLYLREFGIDKTRVLIPDQLKKYVAFLGAEDKYHATLTVAAIHVVHHFVLRSHNDNFTDFIAEFPQLKTGFKKLIASHYGFDIYTSDRARLG